MTASNRINIGAPLAALGALLLILSLFLDWYEPGVTAWTVFEVLDLVLVGLALASLLGAAARLGLAFPGGRAFASRLVVFAVPALVLVISQAINHPPAAVGEDPETGLWLALGGAGVLALGGLLSVTRISLALDVEGGQRPGAGPPSVGESPRQPGETQTAPLDVPPSQQEQR